jgi:hypothetical protein
MKQMDTKQLYNYILMAVLATIVIGGGLFCFNQFLRWHYTTAFLATPCQLCMELNPDFGKCGIATTTNEEQIKKINWSYNNPPVTKNP